MFLSFMVNLKLFYCNEVHITPAFSIYNRIDCIVELTSLLDLQKVYISGKIATTTLLLFNEVKV